MSHSYIITYKSTDGRTVYFDGCGFSLLRDNARETGVSAGIEQRSLIAHDYPECQLEAATAFAICE